MTLSVAGGASLNVVRQGGQTPTVELGAPDDTTNGRQATATAVINDDGEITGFTITDAGAGYTSAPSVTVTGGNPTSLAPVVAEAALASETVVTVSEASGTNEQQTINVTGVTEGTYTVALQVDGTIYRSNPLNYNDSADDMRTVLLAMNVPGADYDVTLTGSEYTVTFKGSLAGRNLETMTLDATNLVGANAVEETTAGSCVVIAGQRSPVAGYARRDRRQLYPDLPR